MKVDIFTIPVLSQAEATAELNRHLSSVRVLSVDRQFVSDGANSFWTLCVLSDAAPARSGKSPSGRKGSVDYRDVLSAEEFGLYARLRDLRKQLADRDGVPPYAVFTNEQLATIVQTRASSLTRLKDIDGIGEARIGKYGAAVVGLLTTAPPIQVDAAVET